MPGEWLVDPAGGTGLGLTDQPSTCQALGRFLQSDICRFYLDEKYKQFFPAGALSSTAEIVSKSTTTCFLLI